MIKCTSWKPIASQAASALLLLGEHSIGPPLSLVVGVVFGCIWSMVSILPWGNVRYNASLGGWSALGGAHLWTLCLHTWRMLRDTVGGVVPTSSSSHNLAVRGEHQENGACTCAMHAKRSQTRFTIMQWHAMTMFVRTFSVGRYSDWNRLRGLCETKLLVGNPQSWTKSPTNEIPMTRSLPGKTAQSLATFWPHLSGSYLLSPQVRQFIHVISFQSIAIFLQNHHKIWVILNAKCFKHVCCGYFVVVAVLWFSKSAAPIDHWPARPTRASKQSQNPFDTAGATVQNVFALCFFRCLSYNNKYLGSTQSPVFCYARRIDSSLFEQQSKSSCTAGKTKALIQGGLAVLGQKLARTGRFSYFHPTRRHDCFGFRALTLLSRKRCQRLLSRNSFMDDHKKLTTRSWCSIVEK